MESALIALAAILLAHSAYFNSFRQKIPYFDVFCNKTMFRYATNVRLASFLALTCSLRLLLDLSLSLSGSMALCDSHSGSQWLSLPLSGILWPSLAHYCSLISRIQPLIGSQGPCSALIADATMTHFIPLWQVGMFEGQIV